MKHLLITALIVLAIASQATAAPTIGISVGRVCDEAFNQVAVRIFNWEPDDNPYRPTEFTVIRRTTAPGLDDSIELTSTPIPLPPYGEESVVYLPEPYLAEDAIGYYEGWAHYEDGYEYLMFDGADSCVEDPYLLRGYLMSEYEVLPCEGIGLLECSTVSFGDLDFLQYVGSGEMLDIYGWPVALGGVSNCGIAITHIEPLGEGATCEETVASQDLSWSTVKALFD